MKKQHQAKTPDLESLARFAWQQAPKHCDPAQGCVESHRIWSMLRWLLKDGQLPSGSRFLDQRIKQLAKRGEHDILISGGADTGLLEILAQACAEIEFKPEVTFVDRCATPCRQNRMLGDALPFSVKPVQSDILKFNQGSYNLIIAHNFLQHLSGNDQPRVIQRWASLLAPGGELSMVQNLVLDETTLFTERENLPDQQAYKHLAGAARAAGFPGDEIDELCQSTRDFWRVERFRAVHPKQLLDDLQSAGLTVDCCKALLEGPDNESGPRGDYQRRRYGLVSYKSL